MWNQQQNKKDVMSEDSKLEEKERLRNAVINELVNTERDYVKDLAYILEEFKDPLEAKDLLTPVSFFLLLYFLLACCSI